MGTGYGAAWTRKKQLLSYSPPRPSPPSSLSWPSSPSSRARAVPGPAAAAQSCWVRPARQRKPAAGRAASSRLGDRSPRPPFRTTRRPRLPRGEPHHRRRWPSRRTPPTRRALSPLRPRRPHPPCRQHCRPPWRAPPLPPWRRCSPAPPCCGHKPLTRCRRTPAPSPLAARTRPGQGRVR